jgi:hypothetical protein
MTVIKHNAICGKCVGSYLFCLVQRRVKLKKNLLSFYADNTGNLHMSSNHLIIIAQTKSWGRVTRREALQNKGTFV